MFPTLTKLLSGRTREHPSSAALGRDDNRLTLFRPAPALPALRLAAFRSRALLVLLLRFLRLLRFFLGEGIDLFVDILEQALDARGIGAEVVAAVTRGGANVDACTVGGGAHAHHHVVAETHDR